MEVLIFVFGLVIGSFLNVCIYRIPLKESIVKSPSHCTMCNEKIKPKDLIPVLSYIILKGKCRYCKGKISVRYPLIEILNAFLYLFCYFRVGLDVVLFPLLGLCSVLLVMSVIDMDTKEIPNRLVLILLVLGVVNVIINPSITIIKAAVGFFAVSVPMLFIALLTGGGMGGGDIKLMAAIGVFLGWSDVLAAFFIACFFAGLIGMLLILVKKKTRKDMIPFGPFLAVGILAVIFFGQDIIAWYTGIAGIL